MMRGLMMVLALMVSVTFGTVIFADEPPAAPAPAAPAAPAAPEMKDGEKKEEKKEGKGDKGKGKKKGHQKKADKK